MIQVKVYECKNGKLIAKSKKVKTFTKAYAFLTPYYGDHYIEIVGKRVK